MYYDSEEDELDEYDDDFIDDDGEDLLGDKAGEIMRLENNIGIFLKFEILNIFSEKHALCLNWKTVYTIQNGLPKKSVD